MYEAVAYRLAMHKLPIITKMLDKIAHVRKFNHIFLSSLTLMAINSKTTSWSSNKNNNSIREKKSTLYKRIRKMLQTFEKWTAAGSPICWNKKIVKFQRYFIHKTAFCAYIFIILSFNNNNNNKRILSDNCASIEQKFYIKKPKPFCSWCCSNSFIVSFDLCSTWKLCLLIFFRSFYVYAWLWQIFGHIHSK